MSVFDQHAERYDAWYDTPRGRAAFESETACLAALLGRLPRPWLEVGVGTGRFAQALGAGEGVDPALGALRMARRRDVRVVAGAGERLPYRSGAFGGVLIAITLCFVEEPGQVLREAHRVLAAGGGVVLGLVLAESPWGRFYLQKRAEGHLFYAGATFYTKAQVEALLAAAGFEPPRYTSTLFQSPHERVIEPEPATEGYHEQGGFVAAVSVRGG